MASNISWLRISTFGFQQYGTNEPKYSEYNRNISDRYLVYVILLIKSYVIFSYRMNCLIYSINVYLMRQSPKFFFYDLLYLNTFAPSDIHFRWHQIESFWTREGGFNASRKDSYLISFDIRFNIC